MIFKKFRCVHEFRYVNNPKSKDLIGIFGNLKDCVFYNIIYCEKCGLELRIKDGSKIKFVNGRKSE